MERTDRLDLHGSSQEFGDDLKTLGKRIQAVVDRALIFGRKYPNVRIKTSSGALSGCWIHCLPEIYTRYFGDKRGGVFVEIGAFDGERHSNTCGLADLGWSGFYVEPVVKFFNQCQKRHARNPQVQVLNLAVGDFDGETVIYLAEAWSTTSKKAMSNYERIGWWKGKGGQAIVKMVTLNRLLETCNVAPGFDLLTIDVEGSEWEIIKGFDINHWKPQMVIIELHDVALKYEFMRDEYLQVVDFFTQHQYRVVYKDMGNTVYVAPELERWASMRLDLEAYFESSPPEYCVLRMGDRFPQYKLGGDLDILCTNMEDFVEHTMKFSERYPEMEFRVKRTLSGHTHVDVHVEGKFHFKFDLIDSLQLYRKFTVDERMVEAIMEHRICKRGVWVPDDLFDLALRYMEYVEWIEKRPDKIKHLHYVEAHPNVDFWSILGKHTSL